MMKRITAVIVLLVTTLISGCWSSREVNTLGISVCIGIDKSDNGYIISEQVINPKAIASKRATNEAPVVVYSVEGENIPENIARMTTISSRRIYHSHLRMVIFSEDIAKEGIADIVDYFLRYHEFRTDFFFAVARGISAKELVDTLTPVEAIPGVDMFNKLKMSQEQWAPTKAMRIVELANDLSAEGIDPTISAVELADGGIEADSTDVLRKSNQYEKIKFTEIGVFQEDKLVGWLDEAEAKGYNYITGNVKLTSGYSAVEGGAEISSDVLKATSKIKATVVDNQPQIDVEIKLKYVITQVKGDLDISKIESIEKINQIHERKITEICSKSVQKAQELKADIFGFGERIHAKNPAYWKTVKDNWCEVFPTVPVHVRVIAEIVSTGDITKTLQQKE
jgi:spore germination protein KC